MRKNIKIIFKKIRMTLMTQMEYRANNFFYVLGSFSWAIISIFMQKYLFDEIITIRGWDFGNFMMLNAIYNFSFSFFLMFSWNSIYWQFRPAVREGKLDQDLLRPVSAQMMLRLGLFDLNGFMHLFPSTAILVISLQNGVFSFTILNIFIAVLLFILGQYILNSMLFLFYSIVFWVTSAEHISDVFWTFEGTSKYPLEIFPKYLRVFFLTLIPIGFLAYIPTKALLGQLSSLSIVYAIVFVIIIRLACNGIWKAGLKRYEGVGS